MTEIAAAQLLLLNQVPLRSFYSSSSLAIKMEIAKLWVWRILHVQGCGPMATTVRWTRRTSWDWWDYRGSSQMIMSQVMIWICKLWPELIPVEHSTCKYWENSQKSTWNFILADPVLRSQTVKPVLKFHKTACLSPLNQAPKSTWASFTLPSGCLSQKEFLTRSKVGTCGVQRHQI